MTSVRLNESKSVAVSTTGLVKRYRLGELHNLKQTLKIATRRRQEKPQLEVLSGLDFTVKRGEAVGLLGTNGSGKSTLLQIIAGTTLPSGGRMRVCGRVMPVLAVGQGFHQELTGRENVTLYASALGIPRATIEARMDDVTAFAELERHMTTPVKRFSSGMISRLSFAIAVQFPADIYIFDEVLAVVDGEFRDRCLHEIKRIHHEGRTIFFVSHSLDQVEYVCDRAIWLEKGKIKESGPTRPLLSSYERALTHAA